MFNAACRKLVSSLESVVAWFAVDTRIGEAKLKVALRRVFVLFSFGYGWFLITKVGRDFLVLGCVLWVFLFGLFEFLMRKK